MTTPLCDRFGIIDEATFSLVSPRLVDDTAPSFAEALVLAGESLRSGTSRVSVCTVRFADEVDYMPVEVDSLLTMTSHEPLEDLEAA